MVSIKFKHLYGFHVFFSYIQIYKIRYIFHCTQKYFHTLTDLHINDNDIFKHEGNVNSIILYLMKRNTNLINVMFK